MRPIKFKAKTKNGGEWVYGDLVHFTGTTFNETKIQRHEGSNLQIYAVIPETVCQFTGLWDKNGKEIYERDIVQVPMDWEAYGFMAGEEREIIFANGGFRFKAKDPNKNNGHYIEDSGVFTVIGNIHDKTRTI
jgi:uncharacterized phage protein (TIGR01671 family)